MTPEQFKQIRSNLGITQKQLAEWLKSSLRSVQRWESGERAISGPVMVCMGYFTKSDEIPYFPAQPHDEFKAEK